MPLSPPPEWVIVAAGCSQIVLALGSLAIPVVLGWREQTAAMRPLIRQVFWTYAGYICASHLGFGLLSVGLPGALVDGTPLAAAVTGFIALWWIVRLVLQFVLLDRSDAPTGPAVRLAEFALVSLFVVLAVTYGWAALAGIGGMVP
jgi:hypothetical protein